LSASDDTTIIEWEKGSKGTILGIDSISFLNSPEFEDKTSVKFMEFDLINQILYMIQADIVTIWK